MADVQPPPEGQTNGGAGVGSKRQRKPSVRLGDIGGDPSYDSHHPRRKNNTHKPYKPQPFSKDPIPLIKPSKTRPLTNLTTTPFQTLDHDREREREPVDTLAIGTWKIKEPSNKRGPTKRPRSNWVSTNEDRDFDGQDSESPFSEEHSPVENFGVDGLQLQNHRRSCSFKGSGGLSDTDATRDWNNNNNVNCEDGVRVWLSGLGLSRYFPVFQVHEVDDEILPMLTLEDLKDMGINAVGTRRKMYSAIQKLGKGFS